MARPDQHCKRILHDKMKMLTHRPRTMGIQAVNLIQQAVKEDSEVFIEAQAQIPAAVYMIHKAIVQFDTWLGNLLYFTSGEGKRNADTEGSKRQWVRKE